MVKSAETPLYCVIVHVYVCYAFNRESGIWSIIWKITMSCSLLLQIQCIGSEMNSSLGGGGAEYFFVEQLHPQSE